MSLRMVPHELVWMLGAMLLLSVWLTWAVRSDFAREDGSRDWWGGIEGFVSLFFMLSMLVSSALQVIVRYAFAELDFPWTEEFGRLAMVWAAFWGAAALQRRDDHIRMSALYDLLPAGLQKLVRILGDLVLILMLVPIAWLGWETARNLDIMHSISLGFPLSVFAYPVPIGAGLMIFHTLLILVRRLMGREPAPVPLGLEV